MALCFCYLRRLPFLPFFPLLAVSPLLENSRWPIFRRFITCFTILFDFACDRVLIGVAAAGAALYVLFAFNWLTFRVALRMTDVLLFAFCVVVILTGGVETWSKSLPTLLSAVIDDDAPELEDDNWLSPPVNLGTWLKVSSFSSLSFSFFFLAAAAALVSLTSTGFSFSRNPGLKSLFIFPLTEIYSP